MLEDKLQRLNRFLQRQERFGLKTLQCAVRAGWGRFPGPQFLDMPLPSVWGPILWTLLHGIGRLGGHCLEKLAIDEERELRWLLTNLETIVPCPECREHIIEYKKRNPLPEKSKDFGHWIWIFHEAVNGRLGKPAGPVWSDSIGAGCSIQKTWQSYQSTIQESILKGSVRGDAIRQWARRLALWHSFH